jgi:hypothetical protein
MKRKSQMENILRFGEANYPAPVHDGPASTVLPLPRHALPENFIDPAQMAVALGFEPIQNLIIDSKRDLGLQGAIVLADHCVSPIFGR